MTITRILGWLAAIGLIAGLAAGFGYAPREAIQGNVQRIMYLHVPSVLTSYLAFGLVLIGSIAYLATRRAGWDRLAGAAGELGVLFTGLTIVTGSIWGKPTWGTWWTWDPRLTSELVLLFLYFGFIALANAFEDPRRGDRAAALLGIIGLVNLPIIYFSVQWWNTLHQGSSVSFKGTTMHVAMFRGMMLMALACWMYAIGAALVRVRSIILEREARTRWVRELRGRPGVGAAEGSRA